MDESDASDASVPCSDSDMSDAAQASRECGEEGGGERGGEGGGGWGGGARRRHVSGAPKRRRARDVGGGGGEEDESGSGSGSGCGSEGSARELSEGELGSAARAAAYGGALHPLLVETVLRLQAELSDLRAGMRAQGRDVLRREEAAAEARTAADAEVAMSQEKIRRLEEDRERLLTRKVGPVACRRHARWGLRFCSLTGADTLFSLTCLLCPALAPLPRMKNMRQSEKLSRPR